MTNLVLFVAIAMLSVFAFAADASADQRATNFTGEVPGVMGARSGASLATGHAHSWQIVTGGCLRIRYLRPARIISFILTAWILFRS
jgi:hypothetical protein